MFIAVYSLSLVLGVSACGDSPTEGLSYEHMAEGNYYVVTGVGSAREKSTIVVPSRYKDAKVKEIGIYAFRGCGMSRVVLPDTVVCIGKSAFFYCTGLFGITMGGDVKTIESNAFNSCSCLMDINFGGTIAQWNAVEKGE